MAIEETYIVPQFPDQESFSPQDITASYFGAGDILTIHLMGEPRPAISVADESDGYEGLYWRVDPETHVLVGIEIHHFVDDFVLRRPEVLVFAELAGFRQDEIEHIHARIEGDYRKREAANLIFASMAESLRTAPA